MTFKYYFKMLRNIMEYDFVLTAVICIYALTADLCHKWLVLTYVTNY